jgi:hypothetical protein
MAQQAYRTLLVHVFGGEAHTDTSYKCFIFMHADEHQNTAAAWKAHAAGN